MLKEFYFTKFDDRKPYAAVPDNKYRTLLFQFSGILTVLLGASYLNWRWQHSLNYDALWFSLPLVIAESLAFVGTVLLVINFWSNKDPEKSPPVHYLSEIEDLDERPDRPIKVDVFIATYNEDVELVRYSIADAKKLQYPYPDVEIKIYVLDDGHRDGSNPEKQNMKQVAEEEGVHYLIRNHNAGYKAGNLKNGMENATGDLFVILDADTRVFPDFLIHTTGYFKRKQIAWVQTPQWFYDLTEAERLSDIIKSKINTSKKVYGRIIDFLFGKVRVNEDVFGNEPRLFYDVILRKRNFYNAAFCCGAGSIHRKEAVMNLALKDFAEAIKQLESSLREEISDEQEVQRRKREFILNNELTPFKYHASEDIYTSIMLHADKENKWESILHPDIECKMLSTQDLDSRINQFRRYASGSLDIAIKDNPLFKKGLTLGQKLCYFNTIWSYFAPLWLMVFLISPVIFYFTLVPPVNGYTFDFFKHFLPFQIMNAITMMLGCWGISTKRGDQYYISSFWYMFTALIDAVKRKKVKFNVTPKTPLISKSTQHILPHVILISLSLLGIVYNIGLLLAGQHPTASGFAANTFWTLFNIYSLSIMIRAANYKPKESATQTI
jgi:cellulose synthase (UDP-forming)